MLRGHMLVSALSSGDCAPPVGLVMMIACIHECINNTHHQNPMLHTKASCLRAEVAQEKLVRQGNTCVPPEIGEDGRQARTWVVMAKAIRLLAAT